MNYAKVIANAFSVKEEYITNIISLLDEGNTIPFIARYRKEMHGTMDDQKIREISDRLTYLRNLDARREEVRSLIENQEKLTEGVSKALDGAETLAEIEDIYRPFRPKRKTRASIAKEKGLDPLANEILLKQKSNLLPLAMAEAYVNKDKGVNTVEEALQGAMDIIAETISDNAEVRRRVRNIVFRNAVLHSVGTQEDMGVYEMYTDFLQPVYKIAGHRILAINRGEKEGMLKVSLEIERTLPLNAIYSIYVQSATPCGKVVQEACEDSYSRLIFPSIEREIRNDITDTASTGAIHLFGMNLRKLLLQPPVKGKVAIGLDPGYRTGCKLAVVDATGKVLDTSIIYPTHGEAQVSRSKQILKTMINRYCVEIIAIGNGTASRETERFTAETLKEMGRSAAYMVVNEAGASVYSASQLAAQEMPEFDLTLRSAVSIARRLQDPLAELVKIEPKAIGVGQYQHDMPQKQLEAALNGVVEECVNTVGADLNTASPSLLSHIAGLSATVSKNIVAYREENGKFSSRAELKKVPRLGPKAFEQCAGFLRVPDGGNPLDNTGVHPESYDTAKEILQRCGLAPKDLGKAPVVVADYKALSKELGVGIPTLQDIVKELNKPGRDMRDELPPPMLRTDVLDMKDLREGMVLKGTVRNVIDFGAFIDIGVHQDGLVHISQISDKYIKHPSEVLSVGDIVNVKILSVDLNKKRISLTITGSEG